MDLVDLDQTRCPITFVSDVSFVLIACFKFGTPALYGEGKPADLNTPASFEIGLVVPGSGDGVAAIIWALFRIDLLS